VHVRMTVFSAPKDGNPEADWEDKAVARHDVDGSLRFLVLDGASEAFDTVRWVDQVASSYAPESAGARVPQLRRDDMRSWFRHLQKGWAECPPVFQNLMEERKFHQVGSFATMLAGVVTGINGPSPRWQAMALGDTVLFHVRADRLLTHFPALTDADFDLRPHGVSTKPARLPEMVERLQEDDGALEPGDTLFVATDALAQWMLRHAHQRGEASLFSLLGALGHPDTFAALVADRREAKEMVNDDVTLLRIGFADTQPSHLVVCL
jgi:hypothetical protein